ncbi:hypothetical protein AAFF_G00222450 [Aldrovandia affinis]|uniref:Uncharacterized protein n=1 Tax=Aldrovandia affinis TaxID=143900 RepID=A0AAD7R0A8_9TELE|nr:hypothetical protein AAFF_G00222450 [Aldrovandia affinis]
MPPPTHETSCCDDSQQLNTSSQQFGRAHAKDALGFCAELRSWHQAHAHSAGSAASAKATAMQLANEFCLLIIFAWRAHSPP